MDTTTRIRETYVWAVAPFDTLVNNQDEVIGVVDEVEHTDDGHVRVTLLLSDLSDLSAVRGVYLAPTFGGARVLEGAR